MIDQTDLMWYAGAAVVTLLVLGRVYAGDHYFNDQARFWAPIRRVGIPLLHRMVQAVDDDAYATYRVSEAEHVATLGLPVDDILDDLATAGYEPQPLASLKTDWTGAVEVASWTRYHGPKPFPGAPDWLRSRQVHVTLFAGETFVPDTDHGYQAVTIVTAHEEANPWRPDQWRDHYRGKTMDIDTGVQLAAADLDIDADVDEPVSADSS